MRRSLSPRLCDLKIHSVHSIKPDFVQGHRPFLRLHLPRYVHAEYHAWDIDFRPKSRRVGSFHPSPVSHFAAHAQISASAKPNRDVKSAFVVVGDLILRDAPKTVRPMMDAVRRSPVFQNLLALGRDECAFWGPVLRHGVSLRCYQMVPEVI
jgi:hypothetical protein